MNIAQRKKQFNEQNHHRGLYWPNGYSTSWRLGSDERYRQLVCVECEGTGVDNTVDDFFDYGLGAGDSCPACHGKSVTDRLYYCSYWHPRRNSLAESWRVYKTVCPWKRRLHAAYRLVKQYYLC